MVGTLTSIRPDRKPIVLWTPWGAVPKSGASMRQAAGRPKLPETAERLQREPAGKGKRHGQS
jgi:hypothetical protein